MGQTISDEELDLRLSRLTSAEQDTFMVLCRKLEGRWIEPTPAIEDQGTTVETTATTVQSNGKAS